MSLLSLSGSAVRPLPVVGASQRAVVWGLLGQGCGGQSRRAGWWVYLAPPGQGGGRGEEQGLGMKPKAVQPVDEMVLDRLG